MTARITIKSCIEQALDRRPGRTASLDELLLDLPNLTREQVRNNLDYISRQGRVVNDGTQNHPEWRLVAQISRCNLGDLSAGKSKPPAPPKPEPTIVWPAHVQVQRAPSAFSYEAYRSGPTGYRRPDGDDNTNHPSCRGGERFDYRPPLHARTGSPKNRRSAS